jgi:cyclophilin family peptidyl-prolyl cis-trans isomerase
MRTLALLLCLAAMGAAEDIALKTAADLPAEDLVRVLGRATGATYLYPPADLKDRVLGGQYDFQVPQERIHDAADFLIRQCGLDVRPYPPVKVILPSRALDSRFRAPGLDTEIQFDRGPGGWTKPQDPEGSLSAATVEALLAEAAKGRKAALDVLAAMGPRTPPMIASVAKLLADPAVRAHAAAALARFGFPAKAVLPALRDAAKADPALDALVREIEAARHPALLSPALATDTAPGRYVVRFETTQGDFDVEVHRDWAPLAADRFHNLVRIGFFDGARFFRVVPGFVAQFGKSGDPEVNKRWYQSTLKDEPVAESNKRGYLSFAKMPQPNTRSTQVFINLADNPDLDKQGFSAFGRVVKGMEVVDRLYSGYGESPDQGHLHYKGDDYLKQRFPKLDRIKAATIVE